MHSNTCQRCTRAAKTTPREKRSSDVEKCICRISILSPRSTSCSEVFESNTNRRVEVVWTLRDRVDCFYVYTYLKFKYLLYSRRWPHTNFNTPFAIRFENVWSRSGHRTQHAHRSSTRFWGCLPCNSITQLHNRSGLLLCTNRGYALYYYKFITLCNCITCNSSWYRSEFQRFWFRGSSICHHCIRSSIILFYFTICEKCSTRPRRFDINNNNISNNKRPKLRIRHNDVIFVLGVSFLVFAVRYNTILVIPGCFC